MQIRDKAGEEGSTRFPVLPNGNNSFSIGACTLNAGKNEASEWTVVHRRTPRSLTEATRNTL